LKRVSKFLLIDNPQSTINHPQSTIHHPQSTIQHPQSTIQQSNKPQSNNPQSTIHNPQSAISNQQSPPPCLSPRQGIQFGLMEPAPPTEFLDVTRLLETSQPRPRVNLIWWIAGVFLLTLLGTALIGGEDSQSRQLLGIFSAVAMMGLVAGISAISVFTVRRLRAEQQRVEQIGELVQLRRWPEAGIALEQYLSEPARTPQFRAQALVCLAPVLSRLHRFEDAIFVQSYLIDEQMVDPAGAVAMRIGRTMAMLREDRLFDADRAISELRRGPAAGTAMVALIEIYRDVKTGHPAEAIELFQKNLSIMRDQLGHRLADGYALAARAYDLLGREAEAQNAFKNATLLAPPGELFRRYPEVEKLAGRYQPAPAPPEAA
jgi:hypothetical protein